MPVRLPTVEHTPGQEAMTNKIQRSLSGMRQDINDNLSSLTAADIQFTPNPADWVAPAPTNLQDAIRRLAASAGAHPVP